MHCDRSEDMAHSPAAAALEAPSSEQSLPSPPSVSRRYLGIRADVAEGDGYLISWELKMFQGNNLYNTEFS